MKASIQVYHKLKQKVGLIYSQLKLNKFEKTKGRKLAISIIDTITLALYKQRQGIPTKKQIFNDFENQLKCSYKTLVVNINRFARLAAFILAVLLKINHRYASLGKYTDATAVPVCLNKNARRHKTMKSLASWSKTGKGWFYGLKLHLTIDTERNLLSIMFTSANADDRQVFMELNEDLDGLFGTDAGYVSGALEKAFYKPGKRRVIIAPKKNMKKLITGWQFHLMKGRMIIELDFRNLKMFHNLVTSLPRSVNGYLANYIYSLLSYLLS